MWRRWQAYRHRPCPEPAEIIPSISRGNQERVRRAAKQLGYAMEGISTPATRTVGVILPPSAREVYENPFYLEMIRGINQFCNAHQYVSTIVTGRDNDEILSAVRLLVSSGAADAFILLYSRQGDTVIDYLVQANLLYVLIGKAYAYANKNGLYRQRQLSGRAGGD